LKEPSLSQPGSCLYGKIEREHRGNVAAVVAGLHMDPDSVSQGCAKAVRLAHFPFKIEGRVRPQTGTFCRRRAHAPLQVFRYRMLVPIRLWAR